MDLNVPPQNLNIFAHNLTFRLTPHTSAMWIPKFNFFNITQKGFGFGIYFIYYKEEWRLKWVFIFFSSVFCLFLVFNAFFFSFFFWVKQLSFINYIINELGANEFLFSFMVLSFSVSKVFFFFLFNFWLNGGFCFDKYNKACILPQLALIVFASSSIFHLYFLSFSDAKWVSITFLDIILILVFAFTI